MAKRLLVMLLLLLPCIILGIALIFPSSVTTTTTKAPLLAERSEQSKPITPKIITTPAISKSAYQLWLESENAIKPSVFRFYKVDMSGELLADDVGHWTCVYDSFTGLLWEVKQQDGSWQDNEHTYSWYQPPPQNTAEADVQTDKHPTAKHGYADAGSCYAIGCDTHSYKVAVNEEWLCSSTDWRLPYAHELASLDHDENYYPDIDTDYFPNTATGYYWSKTEVPSSNTLAWSVDFHNGFPYITEKRMAYHIRLVTDAPWLKKDTNNKNKQH
jgi:hypothetical protein